MRAGDAAKGQIQGGLFKMLDQLRVVRDSLDSLEPLLSAWEQNGSEKGRREALSLASIAAITTGGKREVLGGGNAAPSSASSGAASTKNLRTQIRVCILNFTF